MNYAIEYPFHFYCRKGNFDAFLKASSNLSDGQVYTIISQHDELGFTCIHRAMEGGNLDLVKLLIQKGAKVEDPTTGDDPDDWTPLHLASFHNRIDIIEYLLSLDININPRSLRGWTPLMVAITKNHQKAAVILVQHGADPIAKHDHEFTLLHEAANMGMQKVVKQLLELGADPDAKAYNGSTPIDFAKNDKIRKMLLRYSLEYCGGVNMLSRTLIYQIQVNCSSKCGIVFAKDGYVENLQYNLFASVPMDLMKHDYQQGGGHELDHKMKAVHSSAALVVNTFGFYRQSPTNLIINGYSKFEALEFEVKCPTGLQGTPPHLDLLLKGEDHVIGIESKFTETVNRKKPLFSDAYNNQSLPLAEESWMSALEYYKSCDRLLYFDVAQIIKHYLGLRNTFYGLGKKISLIYLFWEPTNAKVINTYIVHRKEIDEFQQMIKGSDVEFHSLSYSELWDSWKHQKNDDLREHIRMLEDRYKIEIAG